MLETTRLLVIDDDKALLVGLAETIKREGSFEVLVADNGSLGIQLANEKQPHLIICDVMMPPPNGWMILKTLSQNPSTAAIPFIFLSARANGYDKVNGLSLGADDYITKPFRIEELMVRIHAILRRKSITEQGERLKNKDEIQSLSEKIQELIRTFSSNHDGLAEAMAQMLSLRDSETEEHARRVVELSVSLAQEMGISDPELNHIRMGALLHDVGKIGIPDSILLKPGALTDEERKVMMTHSTLGRQIIQPLGLPFAVVDLVHHHHERWDGNGYPDKLSGESIPLPARIFAIVDVWDALINERTYRPAWPHEKAMAYIAEQSGKHFDPVITEKFRSIIEREKQKG